MRLAESHEPFRSTEIGEFPESWDVLPLGALFDVQQGKALSPSARMGESPRPFLRTANVLWSRLDLETLDRMDFSPEEAERLSLRSGDLLVCEGGEIGRTALWRGEVEDCSYQNHVHRLRAKRSDVVPEFVMYWMQAAFIRLGLYGGIGNRTTIPNLSGARLKQLPLPLPSVSEQQAIAQTLSRLQAVVEMQEKIVATLKEVKAATMAKLFREGLRGEPLKQTEIGEMPRSWVVGRIRDYCEKPQYGYTESARNEPIGPKFLRITDISEHGVDWNSVPYCPCSAETLRAVRLRPGDLVFARIGATTGKSYLITECPEAVFASYLIRLRVKEGLSPTFLSCFFETSSYWRQIQANEGTNVKGGMNASVLTNLICPIPSLDEQEEIAAILNRTEAGMIRAVRERAELRSLFESMLHLLMTGQVRVGGQTQAAGDDVAQDQSRVVVNDEDLPKTVQSFLTYLVRRFEPDRVTLFGPHAPGSPRAFGDVGLLVEMPFRGLARDQAARIAREIPHDFSLDLLVRRPEELRRAREIGDRYLDGILERGRVLYARPPGAPARQPAEAEAKAPRRPPQVLSEETLQAIVRRIVEAAAPERIVLFGSAARGELGPDSDVDLLVVKACADRREVARTIRRCLIGVAPGLPKDVIVVTPGELERYRDTIGLIYRPALREGRVVYAA